MASWKQVAEARAWAAAWAAFAAVQSYNAGSYVTASICGVCAALAAISACLLWKGQGGSATTITVTVGNEVREYEAKLLSTSQLSADGQHK